ncbi:hypothetical protein C2S53_004319 [Perilla frutescens var. hirtella]|uniref:F-box domain-containing protein n=1 Tax=Perilla frutescens var. hirtella TaxID=608512 RepID=A0AAD4INR5_PERFH|nr:hypothetical protein C2S53_004319 [Perilla frutescens var. hirtella]
MNKSKSIKTGDRPSELPDSLIFHIFWLLPMRDVVRTTILSKHWRNLWTTIPCLNFDNYSIHEFDTNGRFREFVNRALIFWRGIKIQKFKINFFSQDLKEPFVSDIDMWVRFAKDNKAEELYLHQMFICQTYSVPQYLFSSFSSLKVLSLKGCSLKINGNVRWNQLKSLTIDSDEVDEDVINQVLCSSPRLEECFLTLYEMRNMSIRSSSLKKLSFNNSSLYESGHPWKDMDELRIWTPNLEALEISGIPYRRCLLKDVSSLTHATLKFHAHNSFSGNDFLQETLMQVFAAIKHVENVTLSDWCIEVLGAMKEKSLLSTMANVKFLKLIECSFVEYELIAGLLETFPRLKMLVLDQDATKAVQYDDDPEPRKFDAKSHLNFQTNLPNSFLRQLREVKVTWEEGDDSIFPLIQIVLKYASKLEKMAFGVKGTVSSNSLVLASQKLLRMKRSSPTAELIFCESWSSSP